MLIFSIFVIFAYLVNHLHKNGVGVILDWVPAHFPKDDHGLRRFDGTALYEHEDPKQGEHPDWGTLIFNFGRSEIKNFLIGQGRYNYGDISDFATQFRISIQTIG